MDNPLLIVDNLSVNFRTDEGTIHAVDRVSYYVEAGETLGLVGESGSGKTVSNLALLGLIPQPPGEVFGNAIFDNQNLLSLPFQKLRKLRGSRISMVFQDPMTSLNPFLTVGEQLMEVTRVHLRHSYRQARSAAIDILNKVGIAGASERIYDYPHQLSGGMRQRVMIAMALLCKPDLLIADEPTTALDVSIQAQILDLMKELQEEQGTAIILVTHDLGVIANMCHRVNVMYAGRVVETAGVNDLFATPLHPYTMGLKQSIPRLDDDHKKRLIPIEGQPPDLTKLDNGCAFASRCQWAKESCSTNTPPLFGKALHRHACLVQEESGISEKTQEKSE